MSTSITSRAERGPAAARRSRATRGPRRLLTPEAGVVLIAALFIAISVWWLLTDVRIVNSDNGRHLMISYTWWAYLAGGAPEETFTAFSGYPPLLHMVGAAAIALFGLSIPAMVIAENLVFVPLLALGCYGTGKVAFGRTQGLLAALFAFATPMIMSLFHVMMVDAPQAAMVALTVWLLLESDRFARPGIAAVAGLAAALGMYTKGTFVLFIAGVVVVMVARGGWRNPKGLAAFCLVGAALAGPWYIEHFDELRGLTNGAVPTGLGGAGGAAPWYGNVPFPEQWTSRNFAWYGWNLVNHQLYVPLALFLLAGLGWSARELVRTRARDSYLPELLAGGFAGYLLTSLIVLKDPRYTLPCLVYMAVLGTAWITALPRRPRLVATGLLVAVFAVNTVSHNLGVGGTHSVRTPWAVNSPIGEYTFTVVNDQGYFEGKPVRTMAPFVDLLNDLHDKLGARTAVPDQFAFMSDGFLLEGVTLLVKGSKLELDGFTPQWVRGPRDAWIVRNPIAVMRPHKPCIMSPFHDGTGIYVYMGRVPKDYTKVKPDCP